MSRREKTCEIIECDLCHSDYDADSEEGRRFRKIPRGHDTEVEMEICEECFETLSFFFKKEDYED